MNEKVIVPIRDLPTAKELSIIASAMGFALGAGTKRFTEGEAQDIGNKISRLVIIREIGD